MIQVSNETTSWQSDICFEFLHLFRSAFDTRKCEKGKGRKREREEKEEEEKNVESTLDRAAQFNFQ